MKYVCPINENIMGDEFFLSEIKKIEIDKWDDGMRRHSDPGEQYILEWVEKNAPWFRDAWNKSCCQQCTNCVECGYSVLIECNRFNKCI